MNFKKISVNTYTLLDFEFRVKSIVFTISTLTQLIILINIRLNNGSGSELIELRKQSIRKTEFGSDKKSLIWQEQVPKLLLLDYF